MFRIFWRKSPEVSPPTLIGHRVNSAPAAVIFLHGFSGSAAATWTGFVELLLEEPQAATWDVFSVGYPTSLRIDVPRIWSADPDLTLCAQGLQTRLSLPPLNGYRALAIVAHSMGGLVAQRAILDDNSLQNRVTQLFMFGTPSAGLVKAAAGALLKRQVRDMRAGRGFIAGLRRDWARKYTHSPPFVVHAIAGDRDEFVPASSSLHPFDDGSRAVIPGNHLEIVRPESPDHVGFRLVCEAIRTGGRHARTLVDGARIAAELGEFNSVVATLHPRAGELDDSALVTLALAMEETGRAPEALSILEEYYRGEFPSTDALGVLGGRLKRRWLAERRARDLEHSREMYQTALDRAESEANHEQGYYHAINIAFLNLMAEGESARVSPMVEGMAERALRHCERSRKSKWRVATEAEAALMLGRLHDAEQLYSDAIAMTTSPRELDSMYSQAARVATRVYGEEGLIAMEKTFGLLAEQLQ